MSAANTQMHFKLIISLNLNKNENYIQQPLKLKSTGPVDRVGNFVWLKWVKWPG